MMNVHYDREIGNNNNGCAGSGFRGAADEEIGHSGVVPGAWRRVPLKAVCLRLLYVVLGFGGIVCVRGGIDG